MDESEIIEAAKNHALGETPDKESRRNLKNVRNFNDAEQTETQSQGP